MPKIAPATIRSVARAVAEGSRIVAPQFESQRGHPVGFGATLLNELLALDGDQGARTILEKHRDALQLIACADPGVLYDIDRKTDVTA